MEPVSKGNARARLRLASLPNRCPAASWLLHVLTKIPQQHPLLSQTCVNWPPTACQSRG